jgi:predicted RecB family nuclease
MSCQWFGGTLDALLKIGNSIYLVDFKTSNHITYKYFLQLAAYRYMLRVIEGINIDGVIVLQLDKDEPGFNEYLLNFYIQQHLEFINHCETTFLSLLYGYYNIQQSERMFKTIFSKR